MTLLGQADPSIPATRVSGVTKEVGRIGIDSLLHTCERRCRWIPSHSYQSLAFQKTVTVVKTQNSCGDLSNIGLRLYNGSLQSEVISPSVYARIEEPGEITRPLHDRSNVTAFPAVAENTGIGQVIRFCSAVMLHTDNVVNYTQRTYHLRGSSNTRRDAPHEQQPDAEAPR